MKEKYTINKLTNVKLPFIITSNDAFISNYYSMFRIIFIEAGTGIININGKSTVFMAPSLFCLNGNEIVILERGCNLKVQAILFDISIINSTFTVDSIQNEADSLTISEHQDSFYIHPFIHRSNKYSGYIELGIVASGKTNQLFKLIKTEVNNFDNFYWACRTRSFFLEILFLIQYTFTDYNFESTAKLCNKSTDLNDIILYLHTNYDKKITLEHLTDIFLMNRTTLSYKFNEATGMSVIDYLIKLRIRVASMLLRDTHLTISEVAHRAGFNTNTYFLRTYKKIMDCTPSEYRNKSNSID